MTTVYMIKKLTNGCTDRIEIVSDQNKSLGGRGKGRWYVFDHRVNGWMGGRHNDRLVNIVKACKANGFTLMAIEA